jgi:hypothetical protein
MSDGPRADSAAHTSLAETHLSFGKSLWRTLACNETFMRYARSYASRGVRRPKAYMTRSRIKQHVPIRARRTLCTSGNSSISVFRTKKNMSGRTATKMKDARRSSYLRPMRRYPIRSAYQSATGVTSFLSERDERT